jgi:S-adenosylmethionine:tRNA ribosyltransferase-isomerase|nr:MAG: S-adenosylmethionine:tRNA ribosyltransferase-isomerase [Bacteroidota bacterium]
MNRFIEGVTYKLSDFRYSYPPKLVAKYPAEPRDSARLMVVHRDTGQIEHRIFRDIVEYFNPGDVLVLNDTRVFPARLWARKEKTNAKIEVLLLRELQAENRLWDVIVDPARKIRIGNKLYFEEGLVAEVIDNTTSRGRTIRFIFDGTNEELYEVIDRIGTPPIPPYLKRKAESRDKEWYQTVYARNRGSVAAPTAGLHFTEGLLDRLKAKGVEIAYITLHIGLGTFRPVEVEDLTKHRMDSEFFSISPEAARIVNGALERKGNYVFVCGTSSVRAVESSVTADNRLKAGSAWTDKFIYPPYDFKITQRLITNFHMPESTLLMLVCAFGGYDLIMQAYKVAIEQEYRLFSYGDAMLII